MTNSFLLTIAIPTYNRSVYLEQLLHSLIHQLYDFQDRVELLVVDNASTDNTSEIVNAYTGQYQLRYIKNDVNIGPDNNCIKCFSESRGKYVLLFGDDDLFLEGAVNYLLNILSSGDYGVVHLSHFSFSNEIPITDMSIKEIDGVIKVENSSVFMALAHVNMSFISANVINRSFFQQPVQDIFLNNNLVQLSWVFNSVLNAKTNLVVTDQIIAGRMLNSSGYDLCTVFVKNMNDIVNFHIAEGTPKEVFDGLFKRLLMFYYPGTIIKIRCGYNRINLTACHRLLWKFYRGNIFYWLFVLPALILPKKIAWFIYTLVDRFRSN